MYMRNNFRNVCKISTEEVKCVHSVKFYLFFWCKKSKLEKKLTKVFFGWKLLSIEYIYSEYIEDPLKIRNFLKECEFHCLSQDE